MRSSQPNYIPVPGKDGSQAITFAAGDSSTVHPWGDRQTALTQGDTSFSIAFRAKLGTTPKGILFALGTHNGEAENSQDGPGGLSFRRGDDPDSIVVATGRNYTGSATSSDQRPFYTFTNSTLGSGAYDNGWHTYVFTCAPTGTNQVVMTLYVDGQQYDRRTMGTPEHLIKPEFQFGDRHGSPFDEEDGDDVDSEAPDTGAIDAFATWNITLFAEGGDYTLAGTGSLTAGTTTANGATLTVETTVNAGNTTLTNTDLTVSDGADLTMGTTTATGTDLTVEGTVNAGNTTLTGTDLAVEGNAKLSANALSLDGTSTLHLGTKPYSFRYLRWIPTARPADNLGNGGEGLGMALAEIRLLLDGQPVSWGSATSSATHAGGSNTGRELIDGSTSSKWFYSGAPATFTGNPPTFVFDAGDGQTFTFDGYQLCAGDREWRTPTTWTLEGSNDNATWTLLDSKDYADETVIAWGRTWAPAESLYRGGITARYVRWSPSARAGGEYTPGVMGLVEFQLLLNGEPVDWNGATVLEPELASGNSHIGVQYGDKDNLIDGDLANPSYWGGNLTDRNNVTPGSVRVTFDAGDGKQFVFDAYRLATMANITGGNPPCTPSRWTLEVSDDGQNWTLVDSQSYHRDQAWTYLGSGHFNDWMPDVFQANAAVHAPVTTTAGARIAGTGLIDGTLTLAAGTVIDATQAAKRGALVTNGTPTITGDGTVAILPPEDFVGKELRLLGWPGWSSGNATVPLAAERFVIDNATTGTLPCYDLEARASGLYLVNKTVICDPWDENLGDTSKNDYVPADLYNELWTMATQAGKREVHVVAYTRGGQQIMRRWASVYAPQVFQGEGLMELTTDTINGKEENVLKVSYEFGISRLWFSTDTTGTTQVNVTATLSSTDGATDKLTFVPGSIIRLRAEKTTADTNGTRTISALWLRVPSRRTKVSTR